MSISTRNLSVVIPFHNEAENVSFVLHEVCSVLPGAEIIAVDDASSDQTWQEICQNRNVRGIRLGRQLGQSGAVYHGLQAATRDWCGLMDGDGQNDPANFLLLLDELRKGEANVACGYRAERADAWNRKAASIVANRIRRCFIRDGVRDTGCSQKIFPRAAVAVLVPFRGMHRYLPAFFLSAGYRLAEVPVAHRSRRAGTSHYKNWSRAVAGIYDLVGVQWLLSRRLGSLQISSRQQAVVAEQRMAEPSAACPDGIVNQAVG